MISMKNELYCSVGAFTGCVNARDPRLAIDAVARLECDGLEGMVFPGWEGRLKEIAALYRAHALRCPVLHADKRIGDRMSAPGDDAAADGFRMWEENCVFARMIGARQLVCHLWGPPESDANFERIARRCETLLTTAQGYGLTVTAENCVCVHGSPLRRCEALAERFPALQFTLDTRPAQFHEELAAFLDSPLLTKGRIRHLHINDYAGGYKQWDALYPIRQPGEGRVDSPAFFKGLRRAGYDGTITLESPSMRGPREAVDADTLNRSLRRIRRWLEEG